MENNYMDLHTHTTCSDGKLNPSELMNEARKYGIHYLAITDHNRFDYALYSSIRATIKQSKYKYIKCNLPAVEFDVQLEEGKPKCHVIAVFDDRDEEKVAQIENNIFNDLPDSLQPLQQRLPILPV